jgi:cation transport ATPase
MVSRICHVAGYIAVRTTALAENSTVAKMERLVEEAQNSRSKTQRLIDSCAKYYTPGTPHGHLPRRS